MAELRPQIIPNQIDTGAALIMSGRGNGAKHLADGIAALQRQKEMERAQREAEKRQAVKQQAVTEFQRDLSAQSTFTDQMRALQRHSHLAFDPDLSEGYRNIAGNIERQAKLEQEFQGKINETGIGALRAKINDRFLSDAEKIESPDDLLELMAGNPIDSQTGLPTESAMRFVKERQGFSPQSTRGKQIADALELLARGDQENAARLLQESGTNFELRKDGSLVFRQGVGALTTSTTSTAQQTVLADEIAIDQIDEILNFDRLEDAVGMRGFLNENVSGGALAQIFPGGADSEVLAMRSRLLLLQGAGRKLIDSGQLSNSERKILAQAFGSFDNPITGSAPKVKAALSAMRDIAVKRSDVFRQALGTAGDPVTAGTNAEPAKKLPDGSFEIDGIIIPP